MTKPATLEQWQSAYMECMRRRDFRGALNAIEKCRELSPGNQGLHLHHVLCLESSDQVEQAILLAEELVNARPPDPALLDRLAQFLIKHQQHALAGQLFQHAARLNPANAHWQLGLARTKQFEGNLEQAAIHGESAVELDPGLMEAWFFLSHLKRQSKDHNHISRLESLVNSPSLQPNARAMGFYALAKELEDCQEYVRSFASRANGARTYRSTLQYDGNSERQFIQQIRSTYNSDFFAQRPAGFENNEAIFIVGLPRTGTTLLERIISSHDQVHSAGELTQFTQALSSQLDRLGEAVSSSRTEMVKQSTRIDFAALGQEYLDAARIVAGPMPRFIDKMPQNSVFAGLINLALPECRILLLQRHPMDVCYAIYKQLFTDSFHYSYDLDELADYYIEWQKLMQHWLDVIPGAIQVVRYESLVTNLEDETRKVLSFCNLPWQPQCLEFHSNQQASSTASASQVRQPVYTSSIGLWKHYRSELAPLESRLRQAGCLDGWDD